MVSQIISVKEEKLAEGYLTAFKYANAVVSKFIIS